MNTNNELTRHMLLRYGSTMGGRELYNALGFKTYAAFYRSKQKGELGVTVFSLPGRRGLYALTTDVSHWLENQVILEQGKQTA